MQRAPSGKYVVRWRAGGRQRSRSFSREADARQFDADVKRLRQTGGQVLSRSDVPKLRGEATSWLASRTDLAASTEALYADVLARQVLPDLGGYSLLDLRPRLLEEWISNLVTDSGPRAAQIAYNVLSQILDRAVLHEYLDANKLKYVKRPRSKKRLVTAATPHQVEAVRSYFLDLEMRDTATLISVIAYVGLRPAQEPLGAMWSDFEGRRLHIRRRNVYGVIEPLAKSETQRLVVVPDSVAVELTELRLRRGNPVGLIFPSKNGQPITRTAWGSWSQRPFSRAREAAGLPKGFCPYDLRHTCASLMLASGVSLPEVARQLGNSIEVCASTYAHLVDGIEGTSMTLDERIKQARAA